MSLFFNFFFCGTWKVQYIKIKYSLLVSPKCVFSELINNTIVDRKLIYELYMWNEGKEKVMYTGIFISIYLYKMIENLFTKNGVFAGFFTEVLNRFNDEEVFIW